MMTILQIMRNTELGRRERSELVLIQNFKHGKSRRTGLPKTISKAFSRKPGQAGHRYALAVDCLDTKSHVKVSCSCPDFTFHGSEYMLAQRGAADIIYGNGEPPQHPRKPGCCKHLVMLFKEMLQAGILDGDLLYKPKNFKLK